MLLVTKSHHEPDGMLPDRENTIRMSLCKESVSPWTGASQFLATTNKIIQFSNGREPQVDIISKEEADKIRRCTHLLPKLKRICYYGVKVARKADLFINLDKIFLQR
jgi:hypothetical protein